MEASQTKTNQYKHHCIQVKESSFKETKFVKSNKVKVHQLNFKVAKITNLYTEKTITLPVLYCDMSAMQYLQWVKGSEQQKQISTYK